MEWGVSWLSGYWSTENLHENPVPKEWIFSQILEVNHGIQTSILLIRESHDCEFMTGVGWDANPNGIHAIGLGYRFLHETHKNQPFM